MTVEAPSTLLRDVEVEGRRTDVRLHGDRVVEVGEDLAPGAGHVVDGGGGALLPGLHDHHLHLTALAAARRSVDCRDGLEALRSAAPGPWVRGTGLPLSVDRHVIDDVVADRPVRVQHRGGALWMLNSRALDEVAHVLDGSDDVERDAAGRPTGRLWRYDDRLRPALPEHTGLGADLQALGLELGRYGITSVTDATPDVTHLPDPAGRTFPQHVTFLGRRKLLLRDHDLPTFDELRTQVVSRREEGLPVAVHCVTAESLVLTLAVLDDVGRVPGDRIEHAAIVPPGLAERLVGLRVVTQPAFLADRGDDYLRDVDPRDHDCLYRLGTLLEAGVDAVVSSDAPFGPVDPWTVLRAARDRTTPGGVVVGPDERVSAATALAGYLTDAAGRPRAVRAGEPADLVLLHTGLADALDALDAGSVRDTWVGGRRLPR